MYTVYASYQRPNMSARELSDGFKRAVIAARDESHDTISVNHTLVQGVYKGESETTLKFNVATLQHLRHITKVFTEELSQECILAVNTSGNAFLHYHDGYEFIGKFKEVSEEYATQQDAYTLDGGRFYVAE